MEHISLNQLSKIEKFMEMQKMIGQAALSGLHFFRNKDSVTVYIKDRFPI